MTAVTVSDVAGAPPSERARFRLPGPLVLWMAAAVAVAFSLARVISDNDDLTSNSMFSVAIRTAAPLMLAGLGGLYAERSGTVNIGLEGMMIMGTVFAGWWAWEINPWMGVLGGILGGALAGLLHAFATTTFGVNHIVSGFAINIIAPGVARFMADLLFTGEQGGSVTNSPGATGDIGEFTMPLLSGGPLLGWDETWDPLGWLAERGWFLISDVASLARALTAELRLDVVLAVVLLVASIFVLWRTPFGLRLRSAGERPSAADSLGVSVVFYRYVGNIISGGLAGMAGAVLVNSANRYSQGQTGGRGFLGLATLVVGNWRPVGVAAGAGLFGYFDGITLRIEPGKLILAAILAAVILLALFVAYSALRLEYVTTLIMGAGGALLLFVYLTFDDVRNEFVFMAPFVVTLIVVAARGQASRPPAQAGIPWRKGAQT